MTLDKMLSGAYTPSRWLLRKGNTKEMTQNEMDLADYLDAMPIGETAEIGCHFVERQSADTYVIDNRDRVCFVQAYDLLKGLI